MPARFPSLSRSGTSICKRNIAIGATEVLSLLVGTIYGSAGVKIIELAMGVAGGKLNTLYFVLSAKAAAIVLRRVVIAGISRP
jgi:hypothetical protein